MKHLSAFTAAALIAAGTLFIAPATLSADIIIVQANDPSFENILFTAPGLQLGPATTVQGQTNSGVRVDFISGGLGNLVVMGQQIEAQGGGTFDDVTIQAQMGEIFSKLIFNLNVDADGTVTFNTAPGSILGTNTFNVLGNGQNFFTLQAINGQTLSSVTLNLGGGAQIEDIRQIRAGLQVGEVPEPGSVMLLGSGLVGLLLFARKRLVA